MKKQEKTISTRKKAPERILQFGGGNFLRAFTDWMFHVLNSTTDFNGSVVVIKPTEKGEYQELKEQDGLFHVALDGYKNGNLVSEVTLIKSISRTIHPYRQWQKYLELAEQSEMRFIVSNTTEAGIQFSDTDALDHAPPKEFPAKLTRWLYHRFQYFEGDTNKGCIILPCELIEQNGDRLKSVVLQYAEHWKLKTKFGNWIKEHNYFCNTLVDRIVSGYPTERAEKIRAQIDFEDKLLVAGEQYHSWIIQGANDATQKELPFHKTNLHVQFVDDITEYREMKVRILNGAHTAMVPVGYLSGVRTVKEVMNDTDISTFVEELLSNEIITTLTNLPQDEVHKFVNDTLDRFRNPTLKHFLINISLNSCSKFVTRLLPAIKECVIENGQLPKRIVFAFSCLIRMYKGEYNNENINLNDNTEILDFFRNNWKKKEDKLISYEELVLVSLKNSDIWGEDLDKIHGLSKEVVQNLQFIEQLGVKATMKQITDHKSLV
ncbi:tagaturonate reductase [Aquimarina sp. RZ0]|uniref:tagaturonate reductase n=1 Tax=Aquimarina sp. RZ0 TaxID=2607730 RepID=UPI0011F2CF68|nr:tagaturonate reductase [Aquimarina sp. RZ0]KAA1244772.1 tagaturonate reductase [Aquimarina sp. RZ0]